jgi:hypothetical protein
VHHPVAVAPEQDQGGEADRGRGVATYGLDDDRFPTAEFSGQFAQAFGYDQDPSAGWEFFPDAIQGLNDQRPVAENG